MKTLNNQEINKVKGGAMADSIMTLALIVLPSGEQVAEDAQPLPAPEAPRGKKEGQNKPAGSF